ncbi:MAG: hypothetical protein KAV41_02560 [Candidatus Pacebacteria bacterium]|nr:hypothetical protein [Candidatus Paceibacterota bacterium]
MSWSSRKKAKYKRALVFVAVVILAAFSFLIFYNPSTCQDGKQNQGEEGIDCGGPCALVCGFKIVDPITHWSRPLKTLDGVYSVVALVENLNVSAEALAVPYVFKLYDEKGLLINERRGKTFIPSNKIFPIFEGSIRVGNRIPQRVTFEFTKKPKWVKAIVSESKIFVKNINFLEKNGLPRISAIIENTSVGDIKNIKLIVLALDGDNNLINSSKTVLDLIKKNSSEKAIWTWPLPFEKKVFKIDIVLVSKIN